MRHEISRREAAEIQRSRAKYAAEREAERIKAEREREQRELDEHQSRMEIKYRTQ